MLQIMTKMFYLFDPGNIIDAKTFQSILETLIICDRENLVSSTKPHVEQTLNHLL